MGEPGLDWRDPPPVRPSRASQVAAQLSERPGQWARIAVQRPLLDFGSWWSPLREWGYEVKRVRVVTGDRSDTFRFDTYARHPVDVDGRPRMLLGPNQHREAT